MAEAREAAQTWTTALDESLSELGIDHLDAYYQMGVNNPNMVRSEEMYEAFLSAKRAGKVSHYGVSTHENAASVLEAAAETSWYSLAMIAVTPAGWYDWNSRKLLDGTPDAYVLENGLDVVNADMQSYAILRENFVAAAMAQEYVA